MDTNMSLFNQINSLAYWFLFQTNYKSSVIFDADKDCFFVTIKKSGKPLYSHRISDFSKRKTRLLQFELVAIANSLLHIKQTIRQKPQMA
ncbi:hypothetical protein [Aegicerativicinus sediminis]|uniref:hypothetical protein n=1 Tax=Aegicerativicinus sediminis TaxID=2893202 RepID=UPI001E4D79A7|nr:hypothetical protein [Aegicerativicinus sediminis]